MSDAKAILTDIITKISNKEDADIYLLSAGINYENADKFIQLLQQNASKKTNCALILTTLGGDPDAGYRIMRVIKRYYKKTLLYVFGFCKSTGTLMALGADEIIMGDFGEFGPLDVQLMKDDELSNTSGLSYVQSLVSLNEQLYVSFETFFLNIKQKSGNTITTRTAAEIGSKLAVGVIAPISAQIDPVKLGEVQRAIKIALAYGKRLCEDTHLLLKLITDYPSHGFVIDFEEAKELFPNVRWAETEELSLSQVLFNYVRGGTDSETISNLTKDFVNINQTSNKDNSFNLHDDSEQENQDTNFRQSNDKSHDESIIESNKEQS